MPRPVAPGSIFYALATTTVAAQGGVATVAKMGSAGTSCSTSSNGTSIVAGSLAYGRHRLAGKLAPHGDSLSEAEPSSCAVTGCSSPTVAPAYGSTGCVTPGSAQRLTLSAAVATPTAINCALSNEEGRSQPQSCRCNETETETEKPRVVSLA